MTADRDVVRVRGVTDGVIHVVLDSPPVNMLGVELVAALSSVVDDLRTTSARAVVITGVDGRFSAGGDLSRFATVRDRPAAERFVREAQDLFDRVAEIPAPTIAAIHGYALGGGLELALACDIRVAAPDALLGLPEARWGLLAGAGGTQRLARAVGPGAAKLLMCTAAPVDGHEALRLHLVDRIADDPVAEALSIARQIAGNSPAAVRRIKRCVDEGLELPLVEALEREAEHWADLIPIGDYLEGGAAFFERRAPRYPDVR